MIEKILKELPKMMDDPNRLSQACIYLSSELYTHNTLMAGAELNERSKLVEVLNKLDPETGKRCSVAEAEATAVQLTGNNYGVLKAQRDAIIEVINSIKARLKVLEGERNMNA